MHAKNNSCLYRWKSPHQRRVLDGWRVLEWAGIMSPTRMPDAQTRARETRRIHAPRLTPHAPIFTDMPHAHAHAPRPPRLVRRGAARPLLLGRVLGGGGPWVGSYLRIDTRARIFQLKSRSRGHQTRPCTSTYTHVIDVITCNMTCMACNYMYSYDSRHRV